MEDAADEERASSDDFEELGEVSRVVHSVQLHREAHEVATKDRGTHLAQSWGGWPTRGVSFSVEETGVCDERREFPRRRDSPKLRALSSLLYFPWVSMVRRMW